MIEVESMLVQALNTDTGFRALGQEAFTQVPKTRPVKFTTVERVGGPRDTHRDIPLVAILVWDSSRYNAMNTGQKVATIIEQFAVTHPNIARVRVTSTYNNPDPDSGHQRCQINAELVVK